MVVFTMMFSIVGGSVPVTASADPLSLALAYPEYLAGLQAAGLSYGGVTSLDTFRTQTGATAREAVVLQAAAQSYGLAPSVGGVSWGQLAALQAGMLARNTWARVQVAAASAYVYGSYAWASLTAWGSSLFAYQAAATGALTYASVLQVGLPAEYAAAAASALVNDARVKVETDANKLILLNWVKAAWADPHGSPLAFWSDGTLVKWGSIYGDPVGTLIYASGMHSWFLYSNNSLSAAGALALVQQGQAVPGVRPVSPEVDPMPYDPDSPDDPFPVEQGPLPDGPHLQAVPIPWINDPSSSGTNPPGAPADTPAAPVPYVPPASADKSPIPQAGLPPLPGKKARDAAVALDAAVPDYLSWLKDPISAILNWLGDFLDWLQGLWNTVCAWVGSWVIPSDAGLATAWTQPWQALQANALSRWPFAMASVTGSLVGALITPGSATQTLGALQLNTTVLGMPLSFDMAPALQSLQGFGWIAQGFAWLWLVVSLFISFRPRVVT